MIITGALNSNPSQSYTIQCFVAVPDNTSGNGEGQIPVNTETVTDADGVGEVGFSFLSAVPQVGQAVTASANNHERDGDQHGDRRHLGVRPERDRLGRTMRSEATA